MVRLMSKAIASNVIDKRIDRILSETIDPKVTEAELLLDDDKRTYLEARIGSTSVSEAARKAGISRGRAQTIEHSDAFRQAFMAALHNRGFSADSAASKVMELLDADTYQGSKFGPIKVPDNRVRRETLEMILKIYGTNPKPPSVAVNQTNINLNAPSKDGMVTFDSILKRVKDKFDSEQSTIEGEVVNDPEDINRQ